MHTRYARRLRVRAGEGQEQVHEVRQRVPQVERAQVAVHHYLRWGQTFRPPAQMKKKRTSSMSLLSRKTAYSNRYVSTPFEYKGNLPRPARQ